MNTLAVPTTVEELTEALAAADVSAKGNPTRAASNYLEILSSALCDDETLRLKEAALVRLAGIYRDQKNSGDFASLLAKSRALMVQLPKAKTAKLVRTLIDMFSEIPGCVPLQVTVCCDAIAWADAEKRAYLKQALETRLAAFYLDNKMYTEALALIAQLLSELKRLDDKMVLIDVQLLESRVYFALRNIAKAKASLTSSRTTANSVYCPPLQQAALEMQSGILNAEERDFKTAYSYFCEALEGFASNNDLRTLSALKYMLMCKIMLNQPEEVHSIMHQKTTSRYAGRDADAMKAVAAAMQKRSLQEFEKALSEYNSELTGDSVVHGHLKSIYNTLLEQNLLRVIEPFSRVEIAHVAALVKLPQQQVELKLSQLILDGKIKGILDQGSCVLVTFEEHEKNDAYVNAIDTIKQMGTVVYSLYQKAAALS